MRVLFLHGALINRHMWSMVRSNMPDGVETAAIDLPGHGSLASEQYTNDRALETTVGALDEPTVLVGLSLGGYVAQMTAIARPDLVSGLVLSGATVNYQGWDGFTARMYGFAFPLVSRSAVKAFTKKLRSDFGPEISEPILDTGLSPRGAGHALRRLPGRDYAAELSVYTGPIVVANGERDTPNREGEARFIQLNPQAQSIMIEDSGHACAMTQPARFATAVGSLLASVR